MQNRAKRLLLNAMWPAVFAAVTSTAYAATEELKDNRSPLVVDFIAATYLPSQKGVVVAGLHGLLGALRVDNEGVAELSRFEADENIDFTAVEKLTDSEVLLGTSTGRIYSFDGKTLTDLGKITEFDEPVLDIAIAGGKGWAVGSRGMLAKSADGKKWDVVTIDEITQPEVILPVNTTGSEAYFGVANIILDSVKITATKGGAPLVADTDYTFYPDEGFVQINANLDAQPAPAIAFQFHPGPAFKLGDVSWNVVMFEGDNVTIAGEFGMIVQSADGGATWTRRDSVFTPKEPEQPYWITGTQEGKTMVLVGAAGAVHRSVDAGLTWTRLPPPTAEGLFGVALIKDGSGSTVPVIAGAVGMVGTFVDDKWLLADRSQLKLLSWLKNPVKMPDGTTLLLGGRQTALLLKCPLSASCEWQRVTVKSGAEVAIAEKLDKTSGDWKEGAAKAK
jgi:Photosynthesis system II assembly factor YCF48